MTKKKLLDILEQIKKFKDRTKIKIVDFHVHPHDVMGVVHYSETGIGGNSIDFLKPGSLELLEYGAVEKIGSKIYFSFLSNQIEKIIRTTYSYASPKTISEEATQALVDEVVVLSLEPWAPTNVVGEQYKNQKNFSILASVDVHNEDVKKIQNKIEFYIKEYKIKGLKLHPNLQGFKPQPKDNPPVIAAILRKIYDVASIHNLPVLFHGGKSNFTETIHEKYGFYPRSRTNGQLENFCDKNGKSELFENYTMPTVIAHLGHYGKIFHNYKLMADILKKYPHVYYDTSGLSPRFMEKALSMLPSKRILFGSDAVYNRIAYNLAFLYTAVQKSKSLESKDDMLMNIMGNNYYKLISDTK